jgi:hypothetical protein
MARADRFALRIPDAYAQSVRWRRRRAGRIDGGTRGVPRLGWCCLPRPPGARRHRSTRRRGGPGGPAESLGDVGRAPDARRARACRAQPRRLAPRRCRLGRRRRVDRRRRDPPRAGRSYRQDRESWRARLRQYQAARQVPVLLGDGWLGLDDEGEARTQPGPTLRAGRCLRCHVRRPPSYTSLRIPG